MKPLSARHAPVLLQTVYERITELLAKALSMKGLVFALATWLTFSDKLEGWMWILTAAIVIGGRTLEKVLAVGKFAEELGK